MEKYFDKDFFRFLLGFIAIICTSIIIIFASKLYQEKLDSGVSQVGNVINYKLE